jgi:ATP-binding cassette, subfamily F, member 3
MLTVSRLSKSFAGRVLFEDASLQVNRGDRIALIGPNGAGKTTLFSILLGLDEPDKGEVALQRGVNVGFLPQEIASTKDETVLQLSRNWRHKRLNATELCELRFYAAAR